MRVNNMSTQNYLDTLKCSFMSKEKNTVLNGWLVLASQMCQTALCDATQCVTCARASAGVNAVLSDQSESGIPPVPLGTGRICVCLPYLEPCCYFELRVSAARLLRALQQSASSGGHRTPVKKLYRGFELRSPTGARHKLHRRDVTVLFTAQWTSDLYPSQFPLQ